MREANNYRCSPSTTHASDYTRLLLSDKMQHPTRALDYEKGNGGVGIVDVAFTAAAVALPGLPPSEPGLPGG